MMNTIVDVDKKATKFSKQQSYFVTFICPSDNPVTY